MNFIKKIYDSVKTNSKTLSQKRNQDFNNKASSILKVYGTSESMFESSFNSLCDKRQYFMTKDMDDLIIELKKSFDTQPLLTRVIQNISQKVLKCQYSFISQTGDSEKAERVKSRFKQILKNSLYNEKTFFKEHILNLIKYSNSFCVPFRNENQELNQVLIVQNIGWHVKSSFGTTLAKEFEFYAGNSKNTIYKNTQDVWHYTINKESDEIFAMPLWVSVIPLLRKNSFILNSALDSYNDQSIEKVIYGIGVTKNGTIKQVDPESYNALIGALSNHDDNDIATDIPISVTPIKKEFTSPDKLLEALETQIIAGLYTSKSQIGCSGSGRQDAETQKENTESIVEDFKTALANSLNNTMIKEICENLFGSCIDENEVIIEFAEDFDVKERQEKHATYLFQSGLIDLKEARNRCGMQNPIDSKLTFKALYGKNEVNGLVENTNNPTNQYGKQYSTKKTKKD